MANDDKIKSISHMPNMDVCKLALSELSKHKVRSKCIQRTLHEDKVPSHPWASK